MKIDTLVSTMNKKDHDLLDRMRIASGCVVVNQCGEDSSNQFKFKGHHVKWIDSSQLGLSRSRNLAIENSSADICVIADDDLVYHEDYAERILQEFTKRKNSDVIAFMVEGVERPFKTYPTEEKKLNIITSMKISSVQIAFRRKSLIDNNIRFREEFGAGSTFYAGEESIMLSECLRAGLNIYFVPVKIADVHLGNSTWFEGFNEKYFITKGAMFTAMSKLLAIPLIIQFSVRKRKLFNKDISAFQAVKIMLNGRKIYLSGDY